MSTTRKLPTIFLLFAAVIVLLLGLWAVESARQSSPSLQPSLNPTENAQVWMTRTAHRMVLFCADAQIYNSPSLDDKAQPPFYRIPKDAWFPVGESYGDWTLIPYAVQMKELWVLTSDFVEKGEACK